MVEPLLKGEKKKTLSPQQERLVGIILGKSMNFLGNHKSALPHMKRAVELSIQLSGKGSKHHATALNGLGQVEMGLKDYKSAKKRFNDMKAIYKELGMEKSVRYGIVLLNLAQGKKKKKKKRKDTIAWADCCTIAQCSLQCFVKCCCVLGEKKKQTNK